MQQTNLIIRPLITEKSTRQAQTHNEYAFEVAGRANKPEIKLAIEKAYDVKVVDVRTMTRKASRAGRRRARRTTVTSSGQSSRWTRTRRSICSKRRQGGVSHGD